MGRFNASTIATPRLIELCKRKLVGDVSIRWSSTYLMLHRLLSSRQAVSKVCQELGWDSLSNTEWHALKTVVQLFKPFASYTQLVSTDRTIKFSAIVPAIEEIRLHIELVRKKHEIRTCKYETNYALFTFSSGEEQQPKFHRSMWNSYQRFKKTFRLHGLRNG